MTYVTGGNAAHVSVHGTVSENGDLTPWPLEGRHGTSEMVERRVATNDGGIEWK